MDTALPMWPQKCLLAISLFFDLLVMLVMRWLHSTIGGFIACKGTPLTGVKLAVLQGAQAWLLSDRFAPSCITLSSME